MIVRDKSSELGVFLKDSYQETIAKIEEDSSHQEALAIKESTDAAQIKADSIKNEAKRQATSYDLMQLSSGRLEAQRLKQEAQIELLNEVKTKLIDIANNMSPNQKQTFCKALNQNITKKIQEHGFKKQDFSFFCPKRFFSSKPYQKLVLKKNVFCFKKPYKKLVFFENVFFNSSFW